MGSNDSAIEGLQQMGGKHQSPKVSFLGWSETSDNSIQVQKHLKK